ncbi:MAG TPA: hypothetical protein DCE41_12805 [Cytophagales bacterium]|nr:hypothetical protein [Cytophagales bacterium]
MEVSFGYSFQGAGIPPFCWATAVTLGVGISSPRPFSAISGGIGGRYGTGVPPWGRVEWGVWVGRASGKLKSRFLGMVYEEYLVVMGSNEFPL